MHFPCWTVCLIYFSGADILSFFSSIPLAWQVNWWQYTPLLVMFPSLVCTVCPCQIVSIFPLTIISSWSWWCSRIFQSFRNFIFTWSDKERRLLVEKSNRNNLRLQPSSWKAGGTEVKICLLIFFFFDFNTKWRRCQATSWLIVELLCIRVSKVPVTNGPKPCSEQQLFGLYMQLKSYFHIVIISVIFIILISKLFVSRSWVNTQRTRIIFRDRWVPELSA